MGNLRHAALWTLEYPGDADFNRRIPRMALLPHIVRNGRSNPISK